MQPIRLEIDGTLTLRDRPLVGDAVTCLGCPVALAPACTLRSFFLLLDREKSLPRLNPFAGTLLTQFHQSPGKGCIYPGIEHLELTRTVEMTGFPGKPAIRIFISLAGVGPNDPRSITTAGIEQLLDMPLCLGRLKHTIFGDRVDTLEFDTVFNLFELIDGICWELSFHNLPDRCRMKDQNPKMNI